MSRELPFVCIIGAPRSGSTWLQAMIGAHPLVCTTQELKVFDLFTGPWERSWRDLDDLQRTAGGGPRGLRVVWSDDEFYAVLCGLLRDIHSRVLARKPGARVVLDKSPGYSKYVEHIERLVPGVKFVHALRDGRDVAVSLRDAAGSWARSWAPSTIDTAAEQWRSTVSDALQARRLGPERYLEIRYEDLLTNGATELSRAFEFIGAFSTAEDAAAIYARHTFDRMRETGGAPFDLPREFFREGRAGSWCRALTARERYLFHDAAGDLLCELGYSDDGWWIEHGYQRWLIPALGGVRSRRRLRRLVQGLRSLARAE